MAGGGIDERIEEAAQLALLGLDPFKYLFTRDTNERLMMVELHNRMMKLKLQQDENLATAIANQVGKLFKT